MHNLTELSNLFASAGQAVLGTDGKQIVFSNSLALSALGLDPTGQKAESLLPRELLKCCADSFVCAASIAGRQAEISVSRLEDLQILYLDFPADNKPTKHLTRSIMSSLRSSMTGLKLSVDRCCNSIDKGILPDEKYTKILYHYYYMLLRTMEQVDSADLLERGNLPFSPVSTDLVKLCSDLTDTISILCAKLDTNVEFKTTEDQLYAVVDPARIEQLLINLFSNSLQHTKPGGNVTLSLYSQENGIVLSVDDDGEGIPREKLPGIFKLPADIEAPKAQDGLGLGLCIAFGIAQLHNGVLLIESREGEGTRVRVMLPSDSEMPPRFKTPETAYRAEGAGAVLTGLSEVLPSDCYGTKYED